METVSDEIRFKPGVEGLLTPLMSWLSDGEVSEILINQPQEVFIEQRGVMSRYAVPTLTRLHLKRLFNLIANENNRVINEEQPLLSGNLYDGTRVQLVIPPAARDYTLSIRRKTLTQVTLENYEQQGFFQSARGAHDTEEPIEAEQTLQLLYQSQQWLDFITQAILLKKNIVISGGTSSGKTTFLNACLAKIPRHERLITLEDTYELTPEHPNCVRLFSPKVTGNQLQNISMQDLVQCSLRLRPDRILMGEIRGQEILDFVAACATGHEGSMTSIHANNPRIAFMRMVQLYKLNNVPSMRDEDILRELEAVIDIIIQLEKRGDQRLVTRVYYKNAVPVGL